MLQVVAFGNKIPYWYHQIGFEAGVGVIVDGVQYDDDAYDLYVFYQLPPEPDGTPGQSGWAWCPDMLMRDIEARVTAEQPFLVLDSPS